MSSPPPASATKARSAPKPRANVRRRPQAEREAQAALDEQRRQERLAESTAGPTRSIARGNGAIKGRGRGGATVQTRYGDEDRVRAGDTGSVFGPAAAGAGSRVPRGVGRVTNAGVSELIEGTGSDAAREQRPETQPKSEDSDKKGKSGATKSRTKKAAPEPTADESKDAAVYIDSDDDVEEGTTRDIERIWISSGDEANERDPDDEEDQDPISQVKQKARLTKPGTGLRPVRAPRQLKAEEIERRDAAKSKKVAEMAEEMDLDEQFSTEAPSSPDLSKKARKRHARPRDSKVVMETAEEKAERLRYAEDVQKIKDIFITSKRREEVDEHPEEGRLFLFQFPPLTPFLVDETSNYEVAEHLEDPGQKLPPPPPVVKRETKPQDGDVKQEEEGEDPNLARIKVPGALTATSMKLPPGVVGKMNVHKSGKIILDWGGTSMEVRYGTDVDFLQDLVLVDGGESRNSWALGQVQNKLVVIPDWQKLYD